MDRFWEKLRPTQEDDLGICNQLILSKGLKEPHQWCILILTALLPPFIQLPQRRLFPLIPPFRNPTNNPPNISQHNTIHRINIDKILQLRLLYLSKPQVPVQELSICISKLLNLFKKVVGVKLSFLTDELGFVRDCSEKVLKVLCVAEGGWTQARGWLGMRELGFADVVGLGSWWGVLLLLWWAQFS